MTIINTSIHVDKRLYQQDIQGSIAHATMLAANGIISESDAKAIIQGLAQIESEIAAGKMEFRDALEDIHMHVESRLTEIIGEPAARLHTARSRNDQVATDFKLWCKAALAEMDAQLKALQAALIQKAETHAASIMPGFTHLQTAQPVTLGHHLLAYTEMFGRDRERMRDAVNHMDSCPLGAAALAGTSFPIDRHATAKALDFREAAANSMDAVASRDFALETLSAIAISLTHLSRLAEEIILWSSAQFGFIRLSDAFSTGSSIMPQKRNPDAAELVRAKSGRAIGNLVSLLTIIKALPLTYNKDLQEDKVPVFDSFDSFMLSASAMTGMITDMQVNTDVMKKAASYGYANATDLADWLVQNLNIPFRQAHHITGKIVALASTSGRMLEELSLAELQSIEPRINDTLYQVLGVVASVNSRVSFGGTAPTNVKNAVAAAKVKWL
jgi:argininosuccinate lyase